MQMKMKMVWVLVLAMLLLQCPVMAEELSDYIAMDQEEQDVTWRYIPLKVTGGALTMEQVFSMNDLLELAELDLENEALSGLCRTAERERHNYFGLDLVKILSLCGAQLDDTPLSLMAAAEDETLELNVSDASDYLIILARDGAPMENGAGLLADGEVVYGVRRLELDGNPHYEMHNRPPYDQSAGICFTFRVHRADGTVDETVLTTKELEELALEHPDAVNGSWYGIIGNLEDIPDMGAGGYLDYYEGLRFDFLLKEIVGLEVLDGRAELVGRDGDVFNTIEDIAYFDAEARDYYMCTDEGTVIYGSSIPTLAYSKNGSPMLPEHEHDSDAYVRSTVLKNTLEELGIDEMNLGTVKNHNGPFAAALGNCDGYYGGYQVETSGDCVQMDIYLNQEGE